MRPLARLRRAAPLARLRRAVPAARLRRAVVPGVLATCLLAAGCGVPEDEPIRIPRPAPSADPAAPAPARVDCGDPVASYAPRGSLPRPGRMPSGTRMARIAERGRLVAGVSADTLLWGARNPFTGDLEGFDIDVLREISRALLGSPDRVEYRVITTADRVPALRRGDVDVVARTMTITCARWKEIAFSAEYYRAGQKILVRSGSGVEGVSGLRGRRVCAPRGSTSLENLRRRAPGAVPVPADTHTGCLVLFQQGRVDAITGDDAILAGLAAQDPYARVVGPAFSEEPYGLGISLDHPEFVRFVNGVLEGMRADGDWKASYDRWLRPALGPAPSPPRPVYGRRP